MAAPARWDIFCKVVDNYGDAGISWRLARQLAAEHAIVVTLWLDDLVPLSRIAPGVAPHRDRQDAAGVTIRRWGESLGNVDPADVVVEAFGCGLPDTYVAAMARRSPAPSWIILEYLSAEAWIEGTHRVASPHPRLALPRRFWFPGFTPNTGGLLRERGLLQARDAFRGDANAQQVFWTSLGVPPARPGEIRISLFCYPNAALPALLDAWADGEATVTCIVPDGVATGALDRWTGGNCPASGRTLRPRPSIDPCAFRSLPRTTTTGCSGSAPSTSSAARTRSSARNGRRAPSSGISTRRRRTRIGASSTPSSSATPGDSTGVAAAALSRFWRAWNGATDARAIGAAWLEFAAARPHLERACGAWAAKLASLPDLAGGSGQVGRGSSIIKGFPNQPLIAIQVPL